MKVRRNQRSHRLQGATLARVLLAAMLPLAHADAAEFRVVDADTREALEGAVVVIVWSTPVALPIQLGNASGTRQVVEQISSSDGRFSASDIAPSAQRRDAIVFKPGYRPLVTSKSTQDAPLFAQPVIALAKLQTFQDARNYRTLDSVGVHVSAVEAPHLSRVLEIQDKIYDPRPPGAPETMRRAR
jgi:hypothetical protein